MPGIVRRRVVEDEDDEGGSVSTPSSADATPGPSNVNKRVRLSRDGADRESSARDVEDSWVLEPPGTVQRNGARNIQRAASARARQATPTFKPGQLMRVHLRNFVTYNNATFLPGPTLNMIIGPNGTGKSSVVCAICIGLDFGTAPLGRAKELSEFVKHGCTNATIEIELKGIDGQVNPVITLDIEKEGNKKKWHLNGRSATGKDVKKITKKFGIQIDNLCHFLPQDRVVEFSRLSPKERLASTLRGAAPDHMTAQHEQLKELAAQQKIDLKKHADAKKTLKGLGDKQTAQRGDVDRLNERKAVEKNVKLLEHTKPLAQAMQAKFVHDEKKDEAKALAVEIQGLKESLEPGQVAVKAKEKYAKDIAEAKKVRKQACEQSARNVDVRKKELDRTATDLTTGDNARQRIEKDIKGAEATMTLCKNKIAGFEEAMQQEQIEFDPADFNERMRAKKREANSIQEEISGKMDTNRDTDGLIRRKQDSIQQAKNQIARLATEAGKQTEMLRKISPQTVRAWEWVEANRHRFKGEVYAPPVISCSVKDPSKVAMIESLFQNTDFQRITLTNQDDWRMLNQEIHKNQKLVDVVLYTASGMSLESYRPPIDKEAVVGRFDMEGWALDYITGPEPVLTWMCSMNFAHATAVLAQDMSNAQFEEFQKLGLTNCVTPQRRYKVTSRTEYGPTAKSTSVIPINPNTKVWSKQPVASDAGGDQQREIANLEQEIVHLKQQIQDGKDRAKELQARKAVIEKDYEELKEEKEQKQSHNSYLAGLPSKIQIQQGKLEDERATILQHRAELAEAKQKHQKLLLSRAQSAIDYTNAIEGLRLAHLHHITASIAHIEAASDTFSLKQQHSDTRVALDAKEEARVAVNEDRRKAGETYKRCGAQFRTIMDREPDVREWYDSVGVEEHARPPDDLDAEIESQKARVMMLGGADPNAIKQFEERAKRIERLEGEASEMEETVRELEEQIVEIRRTWEPELDALVSKISDAFAKSFERIHCLGSVEVGKGGDDILSGTTAGNVNGNGHAINVDNDEDGDDDDDAATNGNAPQPTQHVSEIKPHDFEHWTIEIMVSFRTHETLSVLDSHRQSGGERAVTTIYYLMALQSLSRAPFRVVDEINQGMDPRNERVVHERMVEVACGRRPGGDGGALDAGAPGHEVHHGEDGEDGDDEEDSGNGSQYFLITPKLLPGLKYDDRMKVHTICSGEFMPVAEGERSGGGGEQGVSMDLGRCVERLEELRSGGGTVGVAA